MSGVIYTENTVYVERQDSSRRGSFWGPRKVSRDTPCRFWLVKSYGTYTRSSGFRQKIASMLEHVYIWGRFDNNKIKKREHTHGAELHSVKLTELFTVSTKKKKKKCPRVIQLSLLQKTLLLLLLQIIISGQKKKTPTKKYTKPTEKKKEPFQPFCFYGFIGSYCTLDFHSTPPPASHRLS